MKQKMLRLAVTCILTLTTPFVCAQQMEDGYTWTASSSFGDNFYIHYPSIQFDKINPNLVYVWFKDTSTNSKNYTELRRVIDCSNLMSAITNLTTFDGVGRAVSNGQFTIEFTATRPNSVGEMLYKAACTYKAYLQRVVP